MESEGQGDHGHGVVDNRRRPDEPPAMKSLALLLTLCLMYASASHVNAATIHEITAKDINGKEVSLGDYKGKVFLIVNVASKCGYTPQYKTLEALYQKYKDQGLVILAFPCNQFGNQEPGTSEEIKAFCSSTYGVTFPLFEKIEVNGPNRHPLYAALAGDASPVKGDIKWNFTKFLVGRDGAILKRFEPRVTPDSVELTAAVEAALAAK